MRQTGTQKEPSAGPQGTPCLGDVTRPVRWLQVMEAPAIEQGAGPSVMDGQSTDIGTSELANRHGNARASQRGFGQIHAKSRPSQSSKVAEFGSKPTAKIKHRAHSAEPRALNRIRQFVRRARQVPTQVLIRHVLIDAHHMVKYVRTVTSRMRTRLCTQSSLQPRRRSSGPSMLPKAEAVNVRICRNPSEP